MTLMGKTKMTAAAALMAGALFASTSMAAPAGSPTATQGITKATPDNIELVRRGWRGHRGHRHGGWGNGWGWGAAAAGLLLAAPYLADDGYAYSGSYADDYDGDGYAYSAGGAERCAATFRSFDPRSGTYMGYDGIRRTCPYL
jgi:hypothetical protein